MKEKEYEMDDDYKRAAQFLVERLAEREEIAAQLKLLPPEKRPEGLRLLSDLDKAIERSEQTLANDYEAQQNHQRALDEQAQAWEKALHAAAGSLIHVKYRLPDKFEEAFNILTKVWSNKEIEAFEDRIEKMEAGDLVRIIRRKGETRKQAEVFLKRFRIREKKKRAALFEKFVKEFSGKYVHVKYRQPDMHKQFDEEINELNPEQIKEFHEVVAYLEAHHLIEIIAVEGETPEETAEFLENYRLAERDRIFNDLTENLAGVYVHAKYRHPDRLGGFEQIIDGMEDEQAEQFRAAIARHEAGDLVGIIRREGETKEEAEEYLKKFRAAEARGEMLITKYE